MPRSTQTLESKILQYFQTAPLAGVTLLFGLVKEAISVRSPRKPRRKVVVEPPVVEPPAKVAKPRRRRGPNKPKVKAQPVAELDNLSER